MMAIWLSMIAIIKIDVCIISVCSWNAISLWFEKNKRTGCIARCRRPRVNCRYDKRRDDNSGNEFPLPPHKANHFPEVEPAFILRADRACIFG